MEHKIICPSCGAKIDHTLPKCPYCDNSNPYGAELAYMDKLEDMKEDLAELENIPQQEAEKAFRRQGKKLILIGVTLAVIVGGVLVMSALISRRDENELREQVNWLMEYGMQWDEWYGRRNMSSL